MARATIETASIKPLMMLIALFALTACTSSPQTQGVACAAPSLFVAQAAGPAVVTTAAGDADLRRLDNLEQRGCDVPSVVKQLDTQTVSEQEQRRLDIAEALLSSGRSSLALKWFERADSFAAYQRLLDLHEPQGPLADDAAYLRYEVKRAQLQQAFGEEVEWPVVVVAQPLYVSVARTALFPDTDPDTPAIESLTLDERVYLLDVVVLEDGESYWVQAYYPDTLALGWVPADLLTQYPSRVRERLAAVDNYQGRSYAQQLMFSALIYGMDLSQLAPLTDADFFGGAQAQQRNSLAILERLEQVNDACHQEADQLRQTLAFYLMDEGPAPQPQQAPYTDDMRSALAALTGASGDETAETQLRTDLTSLAHQYFQIRVQGQVDQRLCHSLPNAAERPGLAPESCLAVRELESCMNQVDAIFAE